MIQYRTFRNADPPGLVNVWNECCTGRGAAFLTANMHFEFYLLSKPYFDPAGLIVALEDDVVVGFGYTGFGANAAGTSMDHRVGVLCMLAVLPSHQHKGIGKELLVRCEAYLRQRGAVELYAGALSPRNPFTFAVYGGANSPGFLESDAATKPFLEHHGYRPYETVIVLQRSLEASLTVADARFGPMRQRYEIHAGPRHGNTWWQEAVVGPIELHEYRLMEKGANKVAARLIIWEMEPYRSRWNEHAIGIVSLEVAPPLRRQGLGKFLLAQIFRHLQEQFFTLAEVQVPSENAAALGLVKGLGFGQVDVGHSYRKN